MSETFGQSEGSDFSAPIEGDESDQEVLEDLLADVDNGTLAVEDLSPALADVTHDEDLQTGYGFSAANVT